MRRLISLLIACAWAGFISLIVVPWGRFVGHSHWGNVGWLPFISPPFRPWDMLLNTLLYVPLGIALAAGIRRRSLAWTFAVALTLTVGTEITQVYSHGRVPSMTDVVTNSLGGLIGAGIVYALGRPRRQRALERADAVPSNSTALSG